MSASIEHLLNRLASSNEAHRADCAVCRVDCGRLSEASGEEIGEILSLLEDRASTISSSDPDFLSILLTGLWKWFQGAAAPRRGSPVDPSKIRKIAEIYAELGPDCRSRVFLLRALAAADSIALSTFAELINSDPPRDESDALWAMSALAERVDYDPSPLFPRLLDAVADVNLAVAVLDIANYLTRRGLVGEHPAAGRRRQLADLLASIVCRLAELGNQGPAAANQTEITCQVAHGSGLCIALCDALAQIGDSASVPAIRPVLELSHRRLRTEAAVALARLGDAAGVPQLARMASFPVARPRALAYLDELGRIDEASEAARTPVARAEGELAAWLAGPTQYGYPPEDLELLDERQLYWPAFDDPQSCFLFRYRYRLAAQEFSGIGMVGPEVDALRADIEDFAAADIYAMYAGRQTEHDEISEQDTDCLPDNEKEDLKALVENMAGSEYDDVEPIIIGQFFGERVFVATGRLGHQPGTIVIDPSSLHWYRGLSPDVAYSMHKGRKILRTFNPELAGR